MMIDESKTLHGQAREFILRLGYFIRMVGESIQPDYWVCTSCGNIEYYEREVRCWKCGIGEMIYKGDLK